MSTPTKQSRQPRWFQFGLRALLVLVFVVAAYFAGFGTARKFDEKAIQDAREQAASDREAARQSAMEAELHAFQIRTMRDQVAFLEAMRSTASQTPSNK